MRSARVADDDAVPVAPDQDRVVIHFDVDAFYAQVEEVREPRLRQVPMGVTQKYLIVTCNYPARERGLTKLMGTGDALKRCPELELVSGEDLTPYRQASKQIEGVLRRFGTAQRLGMDEIFLDATKTVHDRIRAGNHDLAWRGWLHRAATCVVQDNGYRPQDLRAQQPPSGAPLGAGAAAAGQPEELGGRWLCVATALQQWHLDGGPGSSGTPWPLLLVVGSAVAEEARRAVKEELGYRMSAGIACNKLLAKLCSGLHKPDDQTILPPPEAQAFVAPLPVRALPNVGGATEVKLAQLEIRTVKQLATLPLRRLLQHFSGRVGSFLFQAARGVDGSQVLESTAPKSITTEDSFRSCTSLAAAGSVLKVLVPDLVERVNEEWTSNGRVPRTLCMKWRYRGQGWQRKAATMQLPAAAHPSNGVPQQEKAVFSAAKALLTRSLEPRFNLTLISIGVTGFQSDAHRDADVQSFQRLLRRPPPAAVLPEGPARKPADAAAADGGGCGGDSAMMRAETSLHLRRDYGSTASPGLMSKRAERRLREAAPAEAAQPRRKVPRPQEGGGGPLCSDSSPEPHRSPSTEGHSAEGPAGVLRAGTLERACSGTAKRPEGRPEQQEAEHSGGLPVVLAYEVGEEWLPEWLLHDSSDTHLRLAEQEPERLPPSACAAAAAGAPLHAGSRPQHQLQTAEGSARLRGSSPAHQQAGTGEEEARAERATGGDMQARRDCSEDNPATAPIAANPAPTPPHATAAGLSRPSVSSPASDSPLPSPDASCRWGCASPLRGASASPVLEPSAAASAALHEELQAFFADTDDGGASGASGASMLMREGDPGSPSRSDAASDAELEAFLQSREH